MVSWQVLVWLAPLWLPAGARFSRSSRQGKNSRLLNWGSVAHGVGRTRPPLGISLFRPAARAEQPRGGGTRGGGTRQRAHARLLRNIAATQDAELVRENDRQLQRELANRRGKEGEDLLRPPYHADFDQGQIRLLEGAADQMDLAGGEGAVRQGPEGEALSANAVDSGGGEEEDVRCIKKVMQIEETVWEDRIRCEHRFTEKCHDTYITDYVPTQERKCDTSFKKNCHITYKPVMYSEPVSVCQQPLVKVCSDTTMGEEVCRVHYQTTCETRFKEHSVEQDEPVCRMVTERKCRDVQVLVPEAPRPRQEALSLGQECEEWPVQRCTLERKTVKKVNPDTACRKVPKEVCAPSNCQFQPAEKVCHEEQQDLIQNIPSESCSLEPQEDCRMETVLVPRLVLQPNCIKVPKEVCVAARVNPRKVKKPVVKEWCYKPSDLRNPGSRLALSQIFAN